MVNKYIFVTVTLMIIKGSHEIPHEMNVDALSGDALPQTTIL